MKIPFTKAHGDRNDFLITRREDIPADADCAALSIAICDRHTGVGADGWILVSRSAEADAAIELYNSDGSRSELSGNGTRCVALYLLDQRPAETLRILTGAGLKSLRFLEKRDRRHIFEMNMGRARIEELRANIESADATLVNVGNPQCAVFVPDFDLDWRALGQKIERHARFPDRTNVSFVLVLDPHMIEVRFWERGAGETMSSGTGSTGAAAASAARGLVRSPVEVRTPAGSLTVRWENDEIFLAGPAEIVARGEFFAEGGSS
ncbi:MAG TPA: diaminopimelate epimerase [Bryobacteraceae bacterium]|jgi:diaminopimelate epimerase|nr:diaminopimelate epimerase [Bryobacteraceae bacterium]